MEAATPPRENGTKQEPAATEESSTVASIQQSTIPEIPQTAQSLDASSEESPQQEENTVNATPEASTVRLNDQEKVVEHATNQPLDASANDRLTSNTATKDSTSTALPLLDDNTKEEHAEAATSLLLPAPPAPGPETVDNMMAAYFGEEDKEGQTEPDIVAESPNVPDSEVPPPETTPNHTSGIISSQPTHATTTVSSALPETTPPRVPPSPEMLQSVKDLRESTDSTVNTETSSPDSTTTATASGEDPEASATPEQRPPSNPHHKNQDDDVASKAAIALAAVAAAATANHKSPAEAAAQARIVAQTLLHENEASAAVPETGADHPLRHFQAVRLTLVKTHLRQRALEAGSQLMDKLATGHNDSFLRHLLLLEYIRGLNDDDPVPAQPPNGEQSSSVDDPAVADLACDRLWSLLKKIEGAYESMLQLLPDARTKKEDGGAPMDYENPVVVPDLLPPCTSQKGDSTLGFFRACTTIDETAVNAVDAAPPSPKPYQKPTVELTAPAHSDSVSDTASHTNTSRSMFSGMFRRQSAQQSASSRGSSSTTSSITASSILGSFRKKKKGDDSVNTAASEQTNQTETTSTETRSSAAPAYATRPGEYVVQIEREMLGLTVENVLERTVVRTVLAGGPAKKAGAKVGSLIVKVGNVETRNLTHFETIDELRQSQRPLVLILKHISEDALRSAREEMGRLIRGSGFGNLYEGNKPEVDDSTDGGAVRPLIGADLRINAFTHTLRRRLAEAGPEPKNKKDEILFKLGEKLIWFQTLFVVGLELESSRLFAMISKNDPTASPRRDPHSPYHHTARDYEDAAKSVAKVLYDFTRKKLDPEKPHHATRPPQPELLGGLRRRKATPPPPPPPLAGRGRMPRRHPRAGGGGHALAHEKPLLQIGDVLQRTRTFLADTTSPPAALLRGELISFLCDVLDFDSDMELSEEDALTATSGAQTAGPINDLGSAGSLLKLIVLNCPIMRSPGCEEALSSDESVDPTVAEELRRRFGPKENFSGVDLHRLHAGNRFLAVVHRLAASRSTSARITACSLGPVIWGHLDFPHQLQLRGVITRALHDVEVIVRKATATVLHEIAELVFDARSVPWLVLMCERAMTDPEPQLRSAAMTLTWHLAEHLPNAFLGDASQGSRYLRRLPERSDPIFADVYLLQCKLLPVATRLAEDRSPSVRLAVAAQCDRLCDALGDHWSSVVIDVLLGLLSDTDERVRREAVLCVPRLADIVLLSTPLGEVAMSEVSILEALVPAAIRLQKDTVPSVRVSLAAAAGELLTLMVALQSRAHEAMAQESVFSERFSSDAEAGKQYKKQSDERLIPLVQVLLNDPDPEVTSAALRAVTNASRKSMATSRHRMHSMASEDDGSVASLHSHASRETRQPVFLPVLSEVQVLRLLPTLSELADSKQWRVRQSAVEIVPALLGCTHKQETRIQISKLCVRLMDDSVDAVRRTAAECLCMGGSSLGSHGDDASLEWIKSIVIPCIQTCATNSISKQRMLSLKMIESVLSDGSWQTKPRASSVTDTSRTSSSAIKELASIALSLTHDRIANVRLNVGRVLIEILDVFEDEQLSFIKEVLNEQLNSEKEKAGDRDVIFFARKCMERADTLLDDRQRERATSLS